MTEQLGTEKFVIKIDSCLSKKEELTLGSSIEEKEKDRENRSLDVIKYEKDETKIKLSDRNLEYILERCKEKKYYRNEAYVYKLCYDVTDIRTCRDHDRAWFVILQKLSGTAFTITNESRIGVLSKNCAKFRANFLKVIEIMNVNDPTITKDSITNEYVCYDSKNKQIKLLKYTVGEIVKVDDFDENLDEICSSGVHYFKTPKPAFYYRKMPNGYTGRWNTYYDGGNKKETGKFISGKKTDKWVEYFCDSFRSAIKTYENDIVISEVFFYREISFLI